MKNQTTTRPTAIILADNPLSDDLKSIFERKEKSTLMIAGHTLIEHVLMELQDLNFEQCIILSKGDAAEVQKLVGDSKRWGMSINVMDYSLSLGHILREYKSLSESSGLLVLEADRLRSHCVEGFLAAANTSNYNLIEGTYQQQRVGITLLKHTNSDLIINAMPIEIKALTTNTLCTTRDFHRANFDVMADRFTGLVPSVRHNSTLGTRQHWASKVHKRSNVDSSNVMIDRHCRVGRGVRLSSVILNHNVYVESNMCLENSIVMPNSIVDGHHSVKNAIISEDRVFSIA